MSSARISTMLGGPGGSEADGDGAGAAGGAGGAGDAWATGRRPGAGGGAAAGRVVEREVTRLSRIVPDRAAGVARSDPATRRGPSFRLAPRPSGCGHATVEVGEHGGPKEDPMAPTTATRNTSSRRRPRRAR